MQLFCSLHRSMHTDYNAMICELREYEMRIVCGCVCVYMLAKATLVLQSQVVRKLIFHLLIFFKTIGPKTRLQFINIVEHCHRNVYWRQDNVVENGNFTKS